MMVSITLDGNDYDHILNVEFIESSAVFLPEWINDTVPDIDTNVWNRKAQVIRYTLRVTDIEKWTLDQLLLGHVMVNFVDLTADETGQVWVLSLEDEWAGDINWANPWIVTIELLALLINPLEEEELSLYFFEQWNYGPPTFGDPLFDEGWNYSGPPSMTTKLIELWSS